MREQKLHDINFLLRNVEQYLQIDSSEEIKNAYQTLLNLQNKFQKQQNFKKIETIVFFYEKNIYNRKNIYKKF